MKHYVLEIIKSNPYLSREDKEFWINAVYNVTEHSRGLYFCTDVDLRKRLDLYPEQPFTGISKEKLFKKWVNVNLWQTSSTTEWHYNNVIQALKKVNRRKRLQLFRLCVTLVIALLISGYFIFK